MLIRSLVLLIVILAVASGCADDEPQEPAVLSSVPRPSSVRDDAVTLGPGVTLRPGEDGRLPVTVRWTYEGGAPETFAVDQARGVLYLDDEYATALDLADGRILWQVGSPPSSSLEGGLASDGGDVIGITDRGDVRFFAPYNFDLSVDPETGTRTRFRDVAGDVPAGLRPFPRPSTLDPHVDVGLHQVVARGPDGRVVWSIDVGKAMYSESEAIAIPGGAAFVLATGLVVVLDHITP